MRASVLLGVSLLTAVVAATSARADAVADLAAIQAAAPACPTEAEHCFGLHVHVAVDDAGAPVVSPEWVAAQVATASHHFAPIGVGFTIAAVDGLPATAAHIETRGARNQLAAAGLPGPVVHVFLIHKLEDVDTPGAPVFGVTWHLPGSDHKYVIVAANAFERTLAHELGHVFGLPHSEYAVSIMNKTKRDQPPMAERRFADEEVALLRRGLRRLLGDRVLTDRTR